MRALFALCFSLFVMTPGVFAQVEDERELPLLDDLAIPGVAELLTGQPRDWIVLKSGGVLIVESVSPRPNTLTRIQERIAIKDEERRKASADQRAAIDEEIAELRNLFVILPTEPGSPEFKLPIIKIDRMIHHEDLIIQRINLLLDEKNIDQSLELYFRLRRDWEDWKGMTEAYQRILFVDGSNRIERGELESSLVVLDELHQLDNDYDGLSELVGRAVRQLIEESLSEENFLRAQFFLNRINRLFRDHPVYQEFTKQLGDRAIAVMTEAGAAAGSGDHRLAAMKADQAVRIWPKESALKNPHRTYAERFQRLHVGVLDLPGEATAYPVLSPANDRHRRLSDLPLFEIDRFKDGNTYYRTRFFDEWEPLDLGRQMRFTIRQFRQPFELHPLVSTPDVVTPILARLDPTNANYDERLASYVESVIVESPLEFSLTFRRVPASLEPLLARVSLNQGVLENEIPLAPLTDPGGFRVESQDHGKIRYLRNLPEPDGLPKYHVAEVVEHKFDSAEKAVQALQRGEVSMLPEVPDWILQRMLADDQFMKLYNIVPFATPVSHVLQFNPESEPLRVKELRSALAYSIDRDRLLREFILRDPNATHGRVVTTPFLSSSPARNVLIEPRRYDISSALAMSLSAQRRLKEGLPPLTMIVVPGEEAEAAAREMVRIWGKIGIPVKLVLPTDPPPPKWDILYRTLQITEPLIDMWPFLTFQERAKLSDLDIYPDWLKQEMVSLDRISDEGRAVNAMQTLHRHLWENVAYVSLWELDKFLVFRRNIQGFPRQLMHCYDEIDRWTIDAWYQTELP
ncbi:MAG: hypothetical protein KDA80_00960 [Planctomycetaceae bacterium]|nr:hypothetical protein [Planctomycetaceae bacterium]